LKRFIEDRPHARLVLESGQRFGARLTSYRSMWTLYHIY